MRMSVAAKSPGYIRKWLQNTESAEVPKICAQALIGNAGICYKCLAILFLREQAGLKKKKMSLKLTASLLINNEGKPR